MECPPDFFGHDIPNVSTDQTAVAGEALRGIERLRPAAVAFVGYEAGAFGPSWSERRMAALAAAVVDAAILAGRRVPADGVPLRGTRPGTPYRCTRPDALPAASDSTSFTETWLKSCSIECFRQLAATAKSMAA